MTNSTAEALISRYFNAFNQGSVEGMVALLAENVVHDVNQGVRCTGKQAFHTFCNHMKQCYKEELKDIVIMASADGLRAAAEYNVHGVYLATDEGLPQAKCQTYVLPAGTFFAIDAGLISRVTTYYNLTDWLMQVSEGKPS
jgi:steroid delta-isomerase-like uncharacterized protein